jgi:hypothetical protein
MLDRSPGFVIGAGLGLRQRNAESEIEDGE